ESCIEAARNQQAGADDGDREEREEHAQDDHDTRVAVRGQPASEPQPRQHEQDGQRAKREDGPENAGDRVDQRQKLAMSVRNGPSEPANPGTSVKPETRNSRTLRVAVMTTLSTPAGVSMT